MGKFNLNEEDFEKIKADAETFYGTVGEVRCPYFGEGVAFNVKGLKHLKFKADRVARSRKDQYARLKLLHLAPEVLKMSRTLQGTWETKRFEVVKVNSRWEKLMKDVVFYEFVAVIDNVRVKVIVKEVDGGEKYFWSVIPYWGIDKENSRRVLYTGDLEHD